MGAFGGFMSGFEGGGSKAISKLKDKSKKKGPGGSDAATNAAPTDEMGGGGLGVPAKHKGGMVKKSRTYRLLKGERVLTKKQAKSYKKKRG